jgi:pimeloyl-ACP methyl ester carboxylesterase
MRAMAFAAAALFCVGFAELGTAAPQSGKIELQGCRVEGVPEEVRCGSYEVYENRDARSGHVLSLKVIVLPARHPHPDEGPVFEIAGGPGETATEFAASYAGSGERDRHDIVLVDERGTGDGHRLDCPALGSDRDLQGYLKSPFDPQAARACRDELQAHFDLRQYSTANFIEDLDEVRQALGYERINIEAGSFGTYESLIYIRDHGPHVRSAFLASLVPLSNRVPLGHARAAQEALDRLFAQCREDSACQAAYPNLQRDFATTLERLQNEPARTFVQYPVGGPRTEVTLSEPVFADTVRLLMYSGEQNRELPFMIEQAKAGVLNPFAQAALLSSRAIYGGVRIGLNYSITCTESVRRIRPEEIEPATRGTYLGSLRVRNQVAVCASWPETHLPAGFLDPFHSTVPAVLVSGEDDPVARPSGAEAVRTFLPNAVHIIVPGAGHTPENECTRNIRRQLFESGSTHGLDLSCVSALKAAPFKLPGAASQAPGSQIQCESGGCLVRPGRSVFTKEGGL